MSKYYPVGEKIPYPCGCEGEFEKVPGQIGERLVIRADPNCLWDAPKVGKTLSWLRYVGKEAK